MLQKIKLIISTVAYQLSGAATKRSKLRGKAIWATNCNREAELAIKRAGVRFSLSIKALEFRRQLAVCHGRVPAKHAIGSNQYERSN